MGSNNYSNNLIFNFEESLSELIRIVRVIQPHLGQRLVCSRLTYGINCCTLSREKRCVLMLLSLGDQQRVVRNARHEVCLSGSLKAVSRFLQGLSLLFAFHVLLDLVS